MEMCHLVIQLDDRLCAESDEWAGLHRGKDIK